jgi:hypothetical protein
MWALSLIYTYYTDICHQLQVWWSCIQSCLPIISVGTHWITYCYQ